MSVMDRKARVERIVRMLLDEEEWDTIRESLARWPEETRAALGEWLLAIATPVTFGKYGRRGLLLGEVYLVDEPYLRWMVKEFGARVSGEGEWDMVRAARLLLERGRSPLKSHSLKRSSRYVRGPYAHLIRS